MNNKATPNHYDFYVIVPPKFESIACSQALELLNQIAGKPQEFKFKTGLGGIEFYDLPMHWGLAFNHLKLATRVLMRIKSFRCRDFPKLFKRCENIAYEQWIPSHSSISWQVATHKSRLNIKKRLLSTVQSASKKWNRDTEGEVQQFYLRLEEDQATVSIDTSGELLHKRGDGKAVGKAPLRESIAFGLLHWAFADLNSANLCLIDPMCGSGTFFLEAFSPANPKRAFAFESWPIYKKLEFTAMKPQHQHLFKRFLGSERHPETFASIQKNIRGISNMGEVHCIDHQELHASHIPEACNAVLIANPPYGKRLKIKGSPTQYYLKLLQGWQTNLNPKRVCVLIPQTAVKGVLQQCQESMGLKAMQQLAFKNGGFEVVAVVFEPVRG